jgi:hypothetical protein
MVGCILASYGTMYSESAFVRASWLSGFLLLLPGNLAAITADKTLIHVRTAYIFFPVAVACNAILWVTCSALWRTLRRGRPTGTLYKYGIAVAATGLVFVVVNTIHFLRPATCSDCFFPYGVPFAFYREGGFAGGGGLVWRGLAADAATVIVIAILLGSLWQRVAEKRG